MKDFLEGLEIGEGKVKLNSEEIKSILTEHGKTVTTENEKVKSVLNNEITILKTQIEDANKAIQSYKDMDIDSIKKSAEDWETKFKELEQNQKVEKEKRIREERVNAFFNDIKFASESAKAGVIAKFNEKDFKYDEETKTFQGASDWLRDLQERDAGAFLSDVVNPKFSANITPPKNGDAMDDVLKIMGLQEEKK